MNETYIVKGAILFALCVFAFCGWMHYREPFNGKGLIYSAAMSLIETVIICAITFLVGAGITALFIL